ncbi:MAG: lysophospholipid acyltransferase family protein [Myxococcaceae bacterium]
MADNESIAERIERLELPFNKLGVDPYGVSKKDLNWFFTALGFLYRNYFRVKAYGIQHVPARGRGMLVGNHSGGVALDGAMVLASTMLDMEPPRLSQGMAEKFIAQLPFAGWMSWRVGQFTGLPEHAIRLLEDDRLLMVFPEGARGTAKLYKERYNLVNFGTGFMRLALQTKSPIIPFGFLGGGAALPTVTNLYKIGRLFGMPYIPVPAYLVPIPLPVQMEIHYGKPMHFQGTGSEDDATIERYVQQVKDAIAELIEKGRSERHARKQELAS